MNIFLALQALKSQGETIEETLLIERREQIIERLRQRGVRKDAIAQGGIGQFAEHRHLQNGHDLAAFECSRRVIVAGLLQATSLSFIVTATQIGMELGLLSRANGAALIAAGVLSVVIFPLLALTVLRAQTTVREATTK